MNTDNTATNLDTTAAVAAPAAPKNSVGRPANKANTKLFKCREIFQSLRAPDGTFDRAAVLAAFQADGKVTKGSANVYLHNVKKSLASA